VKARGIGRENGTDGVAAKSESKAISLLAALAEALGRPGS
jgi:hypothetical protein